MTSHIFNISIDDLDTTKLVNLIHKCLNTDSKIIISYVNVYALNLAYKLTWFRDFLNNSEIVFCDGYGVILASRLLGTPLTQRNTPPDWIDSLSQAVAENNGTLAFVGGREGISQSAAVKLISRHPRLNIPFTHHGYFNKTPGNPENEAVITAINAVQPDILLVGFGMPMQEKWIMENFDSLNAKVFLPVGAAFDYISGNVRRAPKWMTDHGLEWLGRLIIEPRRLWKRYLIGNPLFFYRVLKQKFGLLKFPDDPNA